MRVVKLTKKLIEDLANRSQYLECGFHSSLRTANSGGKQTYLCKKVLPCFTPNAKHKFRPRHIKEQAIRLFVYGNSINSISKALEIPFPTLFKSELKKLVRKLKENYFVNF